MAFEQGTLMRRSFLAIVLLLMYVPAWGATYYVNATGGNNSNSGTATNNAWKTISKVNSSTFSAGDSILFNRGDTWREELVVPSSGSPGSPITFGAYGTGANPNISGANNVIGVAGDWTEQGDGVWRKNIGATTPDYILFNRTTLGTVDSTPDTIYEWTYRNPNLDVYTAPGDYNPASYYTSIEASARGHAVHINCKSYVVVQNIDAEMANEANFFSNCAGHITVDKCTGKYSNKGFQAWATFDMSDITITNNTFDQNGGFLGSGIDIQAAAAQTITNVTISGNHISNFTGDKSGGIFLENTIGTNTVHNNIISTVGAAGIGIDASQGTWSITGNDISDYAKDTSDRGGIHTVSGTSIMSYIIENNYVHDATDATNDYLSGGIYIDMFGNTNGKVVIRNNLIKNINGNGIRIYESDNVIVYYNIVSNAGKDDSQTTNRSAGISVNAYNPVTANANLIYNNVVYLDDNTQNSYGIQIYNSGISGVVSGNIVKNNLVYHNGAAGYAYIQNENDKTADINYNLYWPPIGNTEMHYNGTSYNSFALWQAAGHDANGLEANPLFVSTVTPDFSLQSSSPALDAGTGVGMTRDYAGNKVPVGKAVDIGAYEHQGGGIIIRAPNAPTGLIIK